MVVFIGRGRALSRGTHCLEAHDIYHTSFLVTINLPEKAAVETGNGSRTARIEPILGRNLLDLVDLISELDGRSMLSACARHWGLHVVANATYANTTWRLRTREDLRGQPEICLCR